MYVSKSGKEGTLEYWHKACDEFWQTFESSKTDANLRRSLPTRPVDSFDRFSRVMGLTKMEKL